MSYIFSQNLVSSRKYNIKCPYGLYKPKYIVVHNTANDASAENEVKYMISNNNQVSFHIAVDDVRVIQGLPLNRNAWAAGDGASGKGNRNGIHVEICYSKSGGDKYKKAEENAVYVCAKLLNKYNLPISALKQHADFAKKNCPHRIRDTGTWDRFKSRVEDVLKAIKAGKCNPNLSNGTTSIDTMSATKEPSTSNFPFKIRVVNCYTLNARKGAGTNYAVADVVKKGTILTIVGESGNWWKTKSGLYISKTYTQKI